MATRDEKGRFLPGHSAAGPGRPSRATEQDYMRVTLDKVTLEKWGQIITKAVADAERGVDGATRASARKWLGDYVLGKPPQILELRGAEAHLLAELIEQARRLGKSPSDLFEAMIAEFALIDAEAGDDDDE